MPKWICTECYKQYGGAAIYYRYKHNTEFCCPECGAQLELMNDVKAINMIKELLGRASFVE